MAIADVASRLYSSSAYRNTPVIKALADSVKMNLKFRFSLVGMAAALTGSQTLYQIAQQKYLITDEEKKQAKEEIHFKKYVVSSISTLSKQVALIESIVEKNSLMISAIASDLGYFKGQRKLSASSSYGNIKSFRAPISSRTVKGRIDLINAEIAALKGIKLADANAKQKAATKEVELKEKDKTKALVGAAVGATLGTVAAVLAGGGALSTTLTAGISGVVGAYVSSKVVEQAVKTAIPIVGKAFKIGLAIELAKMTAERSVRRMSGDTGVQTGDKNLDKSLDIIMRPVDNLLQIALLYLGFKNISAAMNAIKKGKSGRGALAFLSKIGQTASPVSAAMTTSASSGAASGGTVVGGRVRVGGVWKTVGGSTAGAATTVARKTKLPKIVLTSLAKLNRWAKGPASKLKFAGVAILAVNIADMYAAAEQYETDSISYTEYKERMTGGYKEIINLVGAAGVGAALGTIVGGPIGFVVGTLGGLGAGFLMDDPSTSAAIKIFNILHGLDSPEPTTGYSASTTSIISGSTGVAKSLPSYSGNLSDAQGSVAKILATIKLKESNNNYKAQSPSSSASGAYQFIDSTWNRLTKKYGIGTEYAKAKDAPPQIQDAVAELYVNEILLQTNGDITKVPLVWYTGNPEGKMSAEALAANKGMTGETYQASWLSKYSQADPNNMIEPMIAGTGLASTLDTQLFQFFGKEFAKVDSVRTEQQTAQDMGARAKIDMVEKAVEISREKSKAELAAMAAETQKMLDMKNLEATNYVDDKAFDEEFAGLYKVA